MEEQVTRTYARHLKKDEFVKIRDDCYRDRTEEHERVCEEPATVFPNGVFKAPGMSVDDCVRIFQTGMQQQATGRALAQQVSNGTAETATQGYDFTTSGPTGSVKVGRSKSTTKTRAGDVNTDTVVTTVPPFKGSYQECQDLAVSSTRERH